MQLTNSETSSTVSKRKFAEWPPFFFGTSLATFFFKSWSSRLHLHHHHNSSGSLSLLLSRVLMYSNFLVVGLSLLSDLFVFEKKILGRQSFLLRVSLCTQSCAIVFGKSPMIPLLEAAVLLIAILPAHMTPLELAEKANTSHFFGGGH